MEGTKDFVSLTRREIYHTMVSFEDHLTSDGGLEDITELVFSTAIKLEGTQMLCKPSLDLCETMSSFECMHPKMDARMVRNSVIHPKTAPETSKLTPSQR
jgi:hypothetical protein